MACLVATKPIKKLANDVGISDQRAVTLVQIWQETYNKSLEELPTIQELKGLKEAVQFTDNIAVDFNNLTQEERQEYLSTDKEIRDNFISRYKFKIARENEAITQSIDELLTGENQDENENEQNNSYMPQGIVTLEQRRAANLAFTPQKKRDRVTLIEKRMEDEISDYIRDAVYKLNHRVMEDPNLTDEERAELNEQIYVYQSDKGRIQALREMTPRGLVDKILNEFKAALADINELAKAIYWDKYEQFTKFYGSIEESPVTKEQIWEAAQKRAVYKQAEIAKVVEHYRALMEEVVPLFKKNEGVELYSEDINNDEEEIKESNKESETEIIDENDPYSKEEAPVKDGWMTNFREVSTRDSLSQKVRKLLWETPRVYYDAEDNEYYSEDDDLGNTRYLDSDYTYSTIMQVLKYMTSADEMIPLLEQAQSQYHWLENVINGLKEDDQLFSQFYTNFRKDTVNYWIQKSENKGGRKKWKTIAVNNPSGTYYLLDSWQSIIETGTSFGGGEIYIGTLKERIDNAKQALEEANELMRDINSEIRYTDINDPNRKEIIKEIFKKHSNEIISLLNKAGINVRKDSLETVIDNEDVIKGTQDWNVSQVIGDVSTIFSKTRSDFRKEPTQLHNFFGTAYNNIAKVFNEVTENAVEDSIHQDGKTYYSHVNASYMGKTIKKLKNVLKNDKKFAQYMQETYKQYDWFYDSENDEWNNGWLEDLEKDSKYRDMLDHKVVLTRDGVDYEKWDDIATISALYEEFEATNKAESAWYAVPNLADVGSAEFIKFRCFNKVSTDQDEQGNEIPWKDAIINRLAKTVKQEYNRIQRVRRRKQQIADGKIKAIDNFDTGRGEQFCFFPSLNNYVADIRYTQTGEEVPITFLQKMEELINDEDYVALDSLIHDALEDYMNSSFEEAINKWTKLGLFDEDDNGNIKALDYAGFLNNNVKALAEIDQLSKVTGFELSKFGQSVYNKVKRQQYVSSEDYQELRNEIIQAVDNYVSEGKLSEKDAESFKRYTHLSQPTVIENLENFFWNNTYARNEMIQIFATDLAYYKNMEDFQKRFKEVHAPSLRLNTQAMYKGKKVGRTKERSITLVDNKIVSSVINDIKEILDNKIAKKELTRQEADYILSQFKKVNVADAQAFRSLSSYRAMQIMMGAWSDDMETAYLHLTNPKQYGQWNMRDFNVIWQTVKPFAYGQTSKVAEYDDEGNPIAYQRVGVQHKNSEFLLLALYDAIGGNLKNSPKLRAINQFMEDHQIDVVQFESAVKTGNQGKIDLNDVDSYEDVYKALEDATGVNTKENPDVIHSLDYEDYGIQTATPEHFIDTMQLIGTQLKKLIVADLPADFKATINGKEYNREEIQKLFDTLQVENLLDDFKDTKELFENPAELAQELYKTIRGSGRYGSSLIEACSVNKDGKFELPIHDLIQSNQMQMILNSIIKSRITKQKMKGGSLIQVTSYGLSNDLHIVFEGEGKNKHIKWMECYLPASSRRLYEPLMKQDGTLDIEKLPEDLRKAIGYRVPTEAKYSMVPIYIKGFMPQQNGSAIMLPAEITTLSGSDFDVDKLYVLLPEFNISKRYDLDTAWNDFLADPKNKDINSQIDNSLIRAYKKYLQDNGLSASDQSLNDFGEQLEKQNKHRGNFTNKVNRRRFDKWFKQHKNNYDTGEYNISRVKYDINKPAKEQSKRARNNMMLNIMWESLTNSTTADQVLTPGGFDEQKKAARISLILENATSEELEGKDLMNMSLEELDNIAEKYKRDMDPLSIDSYITIHNQNMIGNNMIGIYANHNSNHALMQRTHLELTSEGLFTFLGKTKISLHNMYTDDNKLISANVSNYLAASVDNTKDNTLSVTNQNQFTADQTALLARLGYKPKEIALLMNQPIVKRMTLDYMRNGAFDKLPTINEAINRYIEMADMKEDIEYNDVKRNQFTAKELMSAIVNYKNYSDMSEKDKQEFLRYQVAVGLLFKQITQTSDVLGNLVRAFKFDTQNGAAGPTIADSMDRILKVNDVLGSLRSKYARIVAPDADLRPLIDTTITGAEDEETLREKIMGSQMPYLQANYTLGLRATEILLSKYFPHYTESFIRMISVAKDRSVTGNLNVKTMNKLYNAFYAYLMTRSNFFGTNNKTGKTAFEKRNYYIKNFPGWFEHIVANNPDIADLPFIKRLSVIKAGYAAPVPVLRFKNVGRLSAIQKDEFMRNWEELLSMGKEGHDLAMGLFLYSTYRSGFTYSPSSFIHLAPIAVRLEITDYLSNLNGMFDDNLDFNNFLSQYMYNNLGDSTFTKRMKYNNKDYSGKIKKTLIIDANDASYKSFVRKTVNVGGFKIDIPHEIISISEKGSAPTYYRVKVDVNSQDFSSFTYDQIEPLGIRNCFIEYEYGVPVEYMQSVFSNVQRNDTSFNQADSVSTEDDTSSTDEEQAMLEEQRTETQTPETSEEKIDLSSQKENKFYIDEDNMTICFG